MKRRKDLVGTRLESSFKFGEGGKLGLGPRPWLEVDHHFPDRPRRQNSTLLSSFGNPFGVAFSVLAVGEHGAIVIVALSTHESGKMSVAFQGICQDPVRCIGMQRLSLSDPHPGSIKCDAYAGTHCPVGVSRGFLLNSP